MVLCNCVSMCVCVCCVCVPVFVCMYLAICMCVVKSRICYNFSLNSTKTDFSQSTYNFFLMTNIKLQKLLCNRESNFVFPYFSYKETIFKDTKEQFIKFRIPKFFIYCLAVYFILQKDSMKRLKKTIQLYSIQKH